MGRRWLSMMRMGRRCMKDDSMGLLEMEMVIVSMWMERTWRFVCMRMVS